MYVFSLRYIFSYIYLVFDFVFVLFADLSSFISVTTLTSAYVIHIYVAEIGCSNDCFLITSLYL